VIPHIQPVPHVFPFAVYRNGFPAQRFQDNDGYQLFRELVGAVIVGTVGDQHGQPVRIVPGAHQVVTRCLAGRIRAVGLITTDLGKRRGFLAQGAVYLVSGNMQKAKILLIRLPQIIPKGTYTLKQAKSTNDIGMDEILRTMDTSVDM